MAGTQRYEVRARRGWLRNFRTPAITSAGFLVVVGGAVLFFGDFGGGGFGRAFALGGIALITVFVLAVQLAAAIRNDRPELVVEPQGVQVGGARVPWPSVWQIVVLTPPDGSGRPAGLGLRLRFGAPLPHGMHHVIYDPGAPAALHLEHRLRGGGLDTERLDAAVRAFAPPDVQVLHEAPDQTTRPPSATTGGRRDTPATVLDVRLRDYSSSSSSHFTYKPHPVVGFTLPDGRHVIAETRRPGQGHPGAQVMVSYDTDDPADVHVHGGRPNSIRRLTSI